MNDSSTSPNEADHDYERKLREMNEALIVSSVRQHELTEQAQNVEKALRESEERLAEELAATQRLQEISTQLIHEENVQALYEQILDAAVGIMHSDYASIQMLYPERGPGGELRLLSHRGFNPEAVSFWEWVRPASQSTCGIALRTHQRVIVADVQTCDFMAGSDDLETSLQTGIHAVQTTPLLSRGGHLLGMISNHWQQPHEPSERDLRLLDVLARQAADLIERSQVEKTLRETDRRKDEFLAMLGHELRNPLGIISTAAQILRRLAPSDLRTEELRDTIERQVIHTSRMLDDLLDVARISSGKIQLKKQRRDFRDIVRQTVEDHRESFDDSAVRLELYLPDQPVPVMGDRTRLSQMLGNLLHNACKFTETGGAVTVKLQTENLGAAAALSVMDTGVGMEPEALGWVFEPFRQVDRTLDRSRGGLGLGLALVKGIAQLHGGEVAASSDGLGRGSTFTIKLPVDRAEPPSAAAPVDHHIGSSYSRVLIIEDNPLAAKNIRWLLQMSGHVVETAHSGPDGVEAARHFRPEFVLCDIGLPGLDGYGVAKALRLDVGLTEAWLIAVSGYAQDERRAQEAGFNAHMLKPVDIDKLQEVIKSIARTRGLPAATFE